VSLSQIKKSIVLWFWLIASFWSVVVGGSLFWDWHGYDQDIEHFSLQEANTRFEDIIIARAWNARHQGVYGKVDQKTVPNPYLEGVVKERDIISPAGIKLTLVNPAYMTRQLNELLEERLGLSAHLTGLNPIRAANAADIWETTALEAFEEGVKEVHQAVELDGQLQMRLMRPMVTEASCLQCHARQGYKQGDVRGGLSVSIPMQKYIAAAQLHKQESMMRHGFIWLIGFIGLGIGRRQLATVSKRSMQSQERFKLLFDHSNDAIFIYASSGNIVSANAEAMNMFGYSQMEFQEMNLFALFADGSLADARLEIEQCKQYGQSNFEAVFRKKLGPSFPAEVSASIFQYDEGGLFQTTIRDITKRKMAEEKVRLLSRSMEQTVEAILITDSDGNIEFVNAAFCQITGYDSSEVIGKNPRILSSGKQDKRFYAEMWQKLGNGEAWQGRVIDKKKDGSFYPALMAVSPILDDSGAIKNYIGIQQDMSTYDGLEAQFLQAQKMEAIGTLVGGIAHDFNNMLAGMTGNLYLVKNRVKDDPYLIHRLDAMEDLSSHAANMIKQLLSFSRKGNVSMEELSFTSFFKESLKLLNISVPENILIHSDICNQPLMVEADASQLQQVVMNLVNNARDALEGCSDPVIECMLESFCPDEVFIEAHPYFIATDYAHLTITDNGSGIPEEHVQHLFEPFFTTKSQDKGTGLGLAMVYGAIKTHHGFVEVESIASERTTFHVYLPLSASYHSAGRSAKTESVKKGEGETILLVDDQHYLVTTGKAVLEKLGYQVLIAENGQQAVAMATEHIDIDLIIMDVVMPLMGGVEAAMNIRKRMPATPIIFATGYDERDQETLVGEVVIGKPFSITELSHLIRKHIGAE